MSLRIFISGLLASFGIAWLAVVVVPFYKMRSLPPVMLNEATDGAKGVFFPKRTGRTLAGAQVYAENGCYQCHSQLVRPTYAGNDLFRADLGGLKDDPDRGDTRRETTAYDYLGEKFAHIGVTRTGPDLSNFGRRIITQNGVSSTHELAWKSRDYAADDKAKKNPSPATPSPEAWTYLHLFRPRALPECAGSICPPHPFLFDVVEAKGAIPAEAIPYEAIADQEYAAKLRRENKVIVPGSDAKALVSYLLALKKDQPVPKALDFGPPKPEKKP